MDFLQAIFGAIGDGTWGWSLIPFLVVLGWAATGVLLAVSFFLNLFARLFDEASGVLNQLYDVVIFAPLWVERRLIEKGGAPAAPAREPKPVGAKAMLGEAERRLAG